MKRREFLRTTGTASGALLFPAAAGLLAKSASDASGWRTFEVTTRVEILKPSGITRIWVPGALINPTPFQKTIANHFEAEGGTAKLVKDREQNLGIVVAEFPAGAKPVLTVTSKVATRNYAVDLNAKSRQPKEKRTELEYFLRPTKLLPTDGIVKTTSDEITKGARTDVEKAQAIYTWIVDNTFRNPKTRGCGKGDIRFMLESRDLGGKCADLNALYEALAPRRRASGSGRLRRPRGQIELGYRVLGPSTEVVTKAQHCRAEVYLSDHGWVPVDPADVRKVALEEPPGNRPLDDDMVKQARTRLFGSWEMNWMAYNFGHD